jgi:hypothetical protein
VQRILLGHKAPGCPSEESRRPPVGSSHQSHRGWHEHDTNQRGIDEDRSSKHKSELLDLGYRGEHERAEDGDLDGRCRGYRAGGVAETGPNGGGVVSGGIPFLPTLI